MSLNLFQNFFYVTVMVLAGNVQAKSSDSGSFDSTSSPRFVAGPASGLYACPAPGAPSRFLSEPYLILPLQPILNRHWKAASNLVSGEPIYLSVQFDRMDVKRPYIGLWGLVSQNQPVFYKLNNGILGEWMYGKQSFALRIQGRWPPGSSLVKFIEEPQGETQTIGTIEDLVLKTYQMGEPIQIGSQSYRLFYYNEIDPSGDGPHQVLPDRYGLMLIYEDYGQFIPYQIPLESILGSCPVAWHLFGGQTVGLRVDPANPGALEIYELN